MYKDVTIVERMKVLWQSQDDWHLVSDSLFNTAHSVIRMLGGVEELIHYIHATSGYQSSFPFLLLCLSLQPDSVKEQKWGWAAIMFHYLVCLNYGREKLLSLLFTLPAHSSCSSCPVFSCTLLSVLVAGNISHPGSLCAGNCEFMPLWITDKCILF